MFTEFLTLLWLLSTRCLLGVSIKCLAIWYDGALMLLITGVIGMPGLCSFSLVVAFVLNILTVSY